MAATASATAAAPTGTRKGAVAIHRRPVPVRPHARAAVASGQRLLRQLASGRMARGCSRRNRTRIYRSAAAKRGRRGLRKRRASQRRRSERPAARAAARAPEDGAGGDGGGRRRRRRTVEATAAPEVAKTWRRRRRRGWWRCGSRRQVGVEPAGPELVVQLDRVRARGEADGDRREHLQECHGTRSGEVAHRRSLDVVGGGSAVQSGGDGWHVEEPTVMRRTVPTVPPSEGRGAKAATSRHDDVDGDAPSAARGSGGELGPRARSVGLPSPVRAAQRPAPPGPQQPPLPPRWPSSPRAVEVVRRDAT